MSDEDIPWVDTHAHFIYRKELTYSWLEKIEPPWTDFLGDYKKITLGDYTLEDYMADAVPTGVSKIIHTEAAFGAVPFAETRLLQKLADLKKIPIGIVAHATLEAPETEAALDHQLEYKNFRGVRQLWGAAKAEDSAFRKGFAALAKRGLSFEDPALWENFHGLASLSKDFPDAKIVLGHCGMPLQRDKNYLENWRRELKNLAQHENVVCKISGLRMTEHDWSFDSVKNIAQTCIEFFTPKRCFFASNWPVDSLYRGNFKDMVEGFRAIIEPYSRSEKQAMLHDNASSFYNI